MVASFLLSLREGLEAALIIGIVLGVLLKINRSDLKKSVWVGAGIAVLASAAAALILNVLGAQFEGRAEELFEGIVMLLAAGVLTWMIFWMRNTAGNLKQEVELQTKQAAAGSGSKALFALAFLAVFREGIELALFLLAVQQTSSPLQTLTGALFGLAGAVVLGILLFRSTRRLSVRRFFQVTNVLLIIFAAGLVGYGVHELNEAGVIPSIIEHVWDINQILSDKGTLGLLLKALVGYNGNPSLTEVIAYAAYLTSIGIYVFSERRPMVASAANG